jgi:hypothetical protein
LLGKDWHCWGWTAPWVAANLSPIVIAATAGYAVVAGIAAACAKPFRRVGSADADLRCRGCGYLLTGSAGEICPECGRAPGPGAIGTG